MMVLLLVVSVCVLLMYGYPVALTLGGTAILFAFIGLATGSFDSASFYFLPGRIFGGIVASDAGTLIAIPVFIFMGLMLERAKIAENLLDTMALLFGPLRGGLGISVILVGMLLAASTGIVGATVVTMGLLSLPTMLKRGYDPAVATGTICASGTLGQIIPPSIVLIILADTLSNAASSAGKAGQVTITDLFIGAVIPGLVLVLAYIAYIIYLALFKPDKTPAIPQQELDSISRGELLQRVIRVLLPPLILILVVLGSILTGIAYPTNAAALGAIGAIFLAAMNRRFNLDILRDVMQHTLKITSMVMMILLGATLFSLVFRSFGGDEIIEHFLKTISGNNMYVALLVVMLVIFLLGFVLDFFEITLVVVPIVAPILIKMGISPIWLGILIAINLQTSFLTPPFGFSLFYLRSVTPKTVRTRQIYTGVIPFIAIQLLVLLLIAFWDGLATWLPAIVAAN